jgi:gamma-glutamyltranspeptidase / glutathione hydrolase
MGSVLTWPIDDGLALSHSLDEQIGDTTTFHIVDQYGNAAAVTTSLGAQFLVVGDTGINMNNRMRFLALEAGDPNELSPGYKVRHTSNPYMAFRNGRLYLLGGNTGADTQPQVQLQQFLNIVEFGFSAQQAVSAPRFVSNGFPSTTYPYEAPNTLDVEDHFPDESLSALEALGHNVQVGGGLFGSGAVLIVGPDGQTAEVGVENRSSVASGIVIQPGE